MDRLTLTQFVALAVVLAALVRWLPGDDPSKDPLGRGAPWLAIELDSYLEGLRATEPDAPQAYLRGLRRLDTDAFFRYWSRTLRDVRKIQAEAGPETFVQFKGMSRNEQWQLRYDLYPIPTTGAFYEDGGSEDDPTLPGATVMVSRLIASQDMDPEDRKKVMQASLERGNRK